MRNVKIKSKEISQNQPNTKKRGIDDNKGNSRKERRNIMQEQILFYLF